MFLNYSLPEPGFFETTATKDSAVVAPGVRIAVEAQKAELRLVATDHVALSFDSFAPAPKWIEIAITLPDQGWRSCRQVFLRYRANGSGIKIRPALRMGRDGGFQDHFAAEEHRVAEEVGNFTSVFHMPPRWTRTALWMDLHLFFTPEEGHFALHALDLTGVQ